MIDSHEALVDARIRTACLVILTVVAVGAALVPLRPVLVPLLVALLFTYCLRPLIDFQMRRLSLPRGVAVGGALLVALAILGILGLIVLAFVNELRASLPAYQARFRQFSREIRDAVPLNRFGIPLDPEGTFTLPDEAARVLLTGVASSAAEAASGVGLVLIFVLFILLGGRFQIRRPGTLLAEIEERAQRYILQMVGFSMITGLLVWVVLAILGVNFAFAFGFIAFLFNFIPTVGPLVATFLPLPVVVLDPALTPLAKVLALGLPAAIQLILAVVQPRVQGTGQNLHPVTTMAALVFFGSIWGILGAALAVPVTGVIRIVLERIPTTRLVAAWMAGDFDRLDTPGPTEFRTDHVGPNPQHPPPPQ